MTVTPNSTALQEKISFRSVLRNLTNQPFIAAIDSQISSLQLLRTLLFISSLSGTACQKEGHIIPKIRRTTICWIELTSNKSQAEAQ